MNFNDHIEGLFEDYQRQRNSLTDLLHRMRALTATATSPRREVSVTVATHGVLSAVEFPTNAYRRLSPTELSRLVMATYAEAKEDVTQQAAAVLAPMVPDGVDVNALVRGTAGTDAFLPEQPRMVTSVREMLTMRQAEP